jgi:stalled ribosome alternative rescue factor ArfA
LKEREKKRKGKESIKRKGKESVFFSWIIFQMALDTKKIGGL